MVHSTLSTLGILGKHASSSLCHIDSGASNHMSSWLTPLVNVKPYLGNLRIQIANVFHVPHLTSSLKFVDQLVDDIYIIVFLGKASSI